MPEKKNKILPAGNVSAGSGNGFAEGAHLDVDRAVHAEMLFDAPPCFAQHAHGVRLVDHEPGIICPA